MARHCSSEKTCKASRIIFTVCQFGYCIFIINFNIQDYLGAVIVGSATLAVLISAELYPDRVTPALVGLAINYTLLVPIYLNWVVKFTAETEMYFGSVARISTYRYAPTENYQQNGTLMLFNLSLLFRYKNQMNY